MRSNLSIDDARELDHAQLLERVEEILEQYDPPQDEIETQGQKLERISRTIDEMPGVYRWLCQLESWCDHWCQATDQMWGRKDERYQRLRQRRDFFKAMAAAAKLRYDGASRIITIMEGFDPTGLPRSRRGRE